MTMLQAPTRESSMTDPAAEWEPAAAAHEEDGTPGREGPGVVALVSVWFVTVLLALGFVVFLLEPLFQQRTQRLLLDEYRATIDQATFQAEGLAGLEVPKKAPALGSPVGILEIGRIELQQVVVEGVSPTETQAGPGHVPGTAGPGQPGNSAILARRAAYGAPFGGLDGVQVGDPILVSTNQGPSIYRVESVRERTILQAPPPDAGSTGAADQSQATSSGAPEDAGTPLDAAGAAANDLANPPESITVDDLYGPTKDDRLTLVTSSSPIPTNAERALVVLARLEGKPYQPTPQNGRTDAQTGLTGDPSAWPALFFALLALAATAVGAAYLYRRATLRTAYLLSVPPLLVFTIVVAEQLGALLPAWF